MNKKLIGDIMNKKNIFRLIAIVLIVVGVFVIAFALISDNDKNNNNHSSNNVDNDKEVNNGVDESDPSDERPSLSYDDVYSMALSLYGGDNVNIELEEEIDRFVIKRIYKATGVVERYYVDKETGFISTDEIIMDSVVTG